MAREQPFGGKFWTVISGVFGCCTKPKHERLFYTGIKWNYCPLCVIAELEQKLEYANEEIGLLTGQIESMREDNPHPPGAVKEME